MDQEDERVLYNIQNGTRMVSMLLFADARMALWLSQMLSRMYDKKLLKHKDLLTFEKFIKVTKGKLDLINVPGNTVRFQQDLKQAQIRYCVMPDLINRMEWSRLPCSVKIGRSFRHYLNSILTGRCREAGKGSKNYPGRQKTT